MRSTRWLFVLGTSFLCALPALAVEGITGSAAYKADWQSAEGPTHFLGNVDLKADFDLGVLLGLEGGSVHLYGLGNHGGDPTKIVGDVQGTSNIETPADTFRLYEAYYAQGFREGDVSILFGLYDLNSEFYLVESQGLFLNASFGLGKELSQTGVNGPSIFPVTAMAARLKFALPGDLYLQTALFDAQAGDPANPYGTHIRLAPEDGNLAIFETGYESGDENSGTIKAGLGCWGYSRASPTIADPAIEGNNRGCYAVLDRTLENGIGAFAKYGEANAAVNAYSSGLALGFVWSGFGIGMARTRLGSDERASRVAAGTNSVEQETAFELTYLWEATPWLKLQPNAQRVLAPGMDGAAKDVTVTGGRFEIHYEF